MASNLQPGATQIGTQTEWSHCVVPTFCFGYAGCATQAYFLLHTASSPRHARTHARTYATTTHRHTNRMEVVNQTAWCHSHTYQTTHTYTRRVLGFTRQWSRSDLADIHAFTRPTHFGISLVQ
mmetsp:Transcript_45045/g.80579  ORF Transcript_45045/g.80579 Transcript_45045/m.80579 type:complete len:123 (+) Transcript_45045:799-1167(+)